MDHTKIVASALGLSIILALVILGTGNASAGGGPTSRLGSPLASAVSSGEGANGWNEQTVKPPVRPDGSISARPNVTVALGLWRNLRPTESALNGVSLLAPGYSINCQSADQKAEGWAVGDSGVILRYCNGVWDQDNIPEYGFENLYAVQAISPTMGVVVGDQGTIEVYQYIQTQGSWAWVKLSIPGINQRLNSVSLVKQGNGSYSGWAVGHADPNVSNHGTLIQATIDAPSGLPNPESHWTNVTGNAENSSLPAIKAFYAVHTVSPTDSWAVGATVNGANGIIVHWNGSQWSVFQNVADALYGIEMKSASEGWAVGKAGAIYSYNGTTWSKVSSPTTHDLDSMAYAPNGEQWIVGYDNALLKYVGGGWQQVSPENLRTDAYDFRAVDFTSGHGWLVGTNYEKGSPGIGWGADILEYDGGLWQAVTPPTDNRLNAMVTLSENNSWAVGAADNAGGTIIHWDGKHWQRWYQPDLPIPKVDLFTISMTSATDGWAAGDPPASGGAAVFLHWDGKRWAEPRTHSPVNNVRVNGLDAFKTSDYNYPVFAWAVADTGNAFAQFQTYNPDEWIALASCYSNWYQMFGVSIIPGPFVPGSWDAWAVGRVRDNVTQVPKKAGFVRFRSGCNDRKAWDWYQDAPGDANAARLYGIKMVDGLAEGPWGYAVGSVSDMATIFNTNYNPTMPFSPTWGITFTNPAGPSNPSNFYSVDIVNSSRIGWFAGYYTNTSMGSRKWALINYIDAAGRGWVNPRYYMVPANGVNIYHRPVRSIDMVSDYMGWAVGDPEDTSVAGGKSVIFQYPFPNFTLDTYPPSRAVLPTGSTTFTVTVNSIGGIGTDVSLSFPYGLPAWASATTINPTSIDMHSIATITVRTNGAPMPPDPLHPSDPYCLMLRGSASFISGDINLPISRDVCLDLYITNRPVDSVSPDHGRYGTVVTINGTGFGNSRGAGDHVSWGNVQLPDSAILSWSNTLITFRPPDTPGLFTDFPIMGRVKVTAGGFDSNDNYTFKMDPWISNISTSPGSGVINVTVTGTSFGNDPGSALRDTDYEHVTMNGGRIAFPSVVSWSNNQIVFTISLSSLGGQVTVTSNGFESNIVGFGSGANKEYLPLLRR